MRLFLIENTKTNFRNTEKKGALSSLTLIILTFKFALEAVSRILIFSRFTQFNNQKKL